MNFQNYAIPTLNDPELTGARVTAVHRGRFEVVTEYGFAHATMKRGLRLSGDDMPTVGDNLALDYHPEGDSVAVAILPRRTLLARQDAYTGERQLLAANVDLVCITTSLNGDFNLRRLERYLAVARDSGAQPVFLLTKLDLADPSSACRAESQVRALAPDCPILCLSAHTGEGMDALREMLTPGTTAVLLGSSGVGKSSLTNALLGRDAMATNAIRAQDDRGRHTTVHRQMLEMPCGALLIDTPGMRQLAIWDASDAVANVFDEVAEAAQHCRFRDCTHTHEPGCAVRAGLENGTLDPGRVANYLKMHAESDRTALLARKRERSKEISKFTRALRKRGR